MSEQLATTPIGKQQVIDLKAGTILRENSRKDNLIYGCPIALVIFFIVIVKCGLITVWIVREYETFDFRCASWNADSTLFRMKRWTLFSNSDPRTFSKNEQNEEKDLKNHQVVMNESKLRRPLYGGSRRAVDSSTSQPPKIDPSLDFGPLPPTFRRQQSGLETNDIPDEDEEEDDLPLSTMVTLTNTQIIPLQGGDGMEDHGIVKMKTIRNRVEKVGSDEEQFIEIDIANAPRIYVSKIKSRQGGDEEEAPNYDLLKDIGKYDEKEKKMKKKKGKGLKKAKKLEMEMMKVNATIADVQKALKDQKDQKDQKNHKKKKNKNKNKKLKKHENDTNTEVTKSPRHLLSGAASTVGKGVLTTPRPHKSSWINGVIDPEDSKFSNKGEIRGYPMHKATKKPVVEKATTERYPTSSEEERIKVSDSTKLMWNMDEMKYTTFMAPKTTEVTKLVVEQSEVKEAPTPELEPEGVVFPSSDSDSASASQNEIPDDSPSPTHRVAPLNPSYGSTIRENEQDQVPKLAKTENAPKEAVYHVVSSQPSSKPPVTLIAVAVGSKDLKPKPAENSYGSAPDSPYYVEVNDADTETVYIKDVTSIYRNMLLEKPETTTKPYDPKHFEMELTKLKDSTMCLARLAFDIWCLFILFSSVPFLMGICVPRWSLFVLLIVFDFLCLVVGFVSSLTIAIMSSIMYFLIDEMSSDALFEFLLVAFVIDIILILYSIIVVVEYRCCSRLVDNFVKDSNSNYNYNYSPVSDGEPV